MMAHFPEEHLRTAAHPSAFIFLGDSLIIQTPRTSSAALAAGFILGSPSPYLAEQPGNFPLILPCPSPATSVLYPCLLTLSCSILEEDLNQHGHH